MKKSRFLVLLMAALLASCSSTSLSDSDELSDSSSSGPYEAEEISEIEVHITSDFKYHFFVSSTIKAESGVKLFLSQDDTISEDDIDVDYTIVDGSYEFSYAHSWNSFFLIVASGSKEAKINYEVPSYDPKISAEATGNLIQFGFDMDTSWANYCDPIGKTVYRQANKVFDEATATLVQKEVNISTESILDTNPNSAEPYYFIALTSKNGVARTISPALEIGKSILDGAIGITGSSLRDIGGTPTLTISGVFGLAEQVHLTVVTEKVIACEGDAIKDGESDDFSISVNLTQLKSSGKFYDLRMYVLAGTYYPILKTDISEAEFASTLTLEGRCYQYQEYASLLKIEFISLNASVASVSLSLQPSGAFLNVSGELQNGQTSGELSIRKSGIEQMHQSLIVTGSSFSVSSLLNSLSNLNTWYDLILVIDDTDLNLLRSDISEENYAAKIIFDSRQYEFKEYNNDLKINITDVPNVAVSSVDLQDIASKPTLIVRGVISTAESCSLLISTGASTILSKPISVNPDLSFEVSLDVSGLMTSGTWYDLKVTYGAQSYCDILTREAGSNYYHAVVYNSHIYRFRSYSNLLKIAFNDDAYLANGAFLHNSSDIPTLTISGYYNASSLSNLLIKEGANSISSTTPTLDGYLFSVDLDLSVLTKANTYYSLVFANGTEIWADDFPSNDLTSTLEISGKTYRLAKINSKVVIYYE